jgi:hypothetical protein
MNSSKQSLTLLQARTVRLFLFGFGGPPSLKLMNHGLGRLAGIRHLKMHMEPNMNTIYDMSAIHLEQENLGELSTIR